MYAISCKLYPPLRVKYRRHFTSWKNCDYFTFELRIYDIDSLMAGKLSALFCRGFDKGRDYYDLVWYLTSQIQPNITLLNNSVRQFKTKTKFSKTNWQELLPKELKTKNYKQIREDLRRFVIDESELDLIKLATFERLLNL